jgi:hypothetical protein
VHFIQVRFIGCRAQQGRENGGWELKELDRNITGGFCLELMKECMDDTI